jgi:hypothetical protein
VLAKGHGDQWVVTRGSTDITGFTAQCGRKVYTVISGKLDFVSQIKGTWDANGIATSAGHGIETVTLKDVWAKTPKGKPHLVVGSQRVEATWRTGADIAGNPGGPYATYSWVTKIQVVGTRDGRSLVIRQLRDGTFHVEDSGTCSDLLL